MTVSRGGLDECQRSFVFPAAYAAAYSHFLKEQPGLPFNNLCGGSLKRTTSFALFVKYGLFSVGTKLRKEKKRGLHFFRLLFHGSFVDGRDRVRQRSRWYSKWALAFSVSVSLLCSEKLGRWY